MLDGSTENSITKHDATDVFNPFPPGHHCLHVRFDDGCNAFWKLVVRVVGVDSVGQCRGRPVVAWLVLDGDFVRQQTVSVSNCVRRNWRLGLPSETSMVTGEVRKNINLSKNSCFGWRKAE